MCGCHCVVVKDLTIGGFPASVGSPIPRGQTLLGQDRPVGRHVIKVFRAYATGRRGRNGNARQRRLWRRSINWRHRRLLSGWKCLGRRIFRHPVVMCASGNCHERQPQSGCLAGSSRIESNADQGRGTRGFPDRGVGVGVCACSRRSASPCNFSATVGMAEYDSFRTCGTTASFTYAMAWRSSISISSMASSRRRPTPPGPGPALF